MQRLRMPLQTQASYESNSHPLKLLLCKNCESVNFRIVRDNANLNPGYFIPSD